MIKLAPFVLAGLFAIGVVASCKQGEGDRCQIDEDCESGLVCTAEMECQRNDTSTGQLDASLPVDAPADTPLPDAPADAPPDAPPDAP